MLCSKYRDFTKWVIYQIYPRSFMDSNGDGIGDLQGIISRLDYIQALGANAVWLCPCFKSPNEDNGYDVSDYRDIMDEFGTMDDMDELIAELHSRGMKLILDLVPNHTSTQHRWFQESRKGRDNPYNDFYYWYDEIPNDWTSCFKGSAWEYDEMRGQYYLHTFAVGQADLNWDNPEVVRAMQGVVDFWAEKGADGFRIDVIDCIAKDMAQGLNGFGPRLHEYIHALFGREEVSHLFTVGESQVTDIEEMARHCAAERNELSTLFVFDHMESGRTAKYGVQTELTGRRSGIRMLRDTLIDWQRKTSEKDLLYTLFTDNHDQAPMISRVGNDRELRYESATCIASMVYLMKGVPFIYQGQEIGLSSAHYDDIKYFDDVECLGNYRELCEKVGEKEALSRINFGSRDNARHPMAWVGSEYGGFSSCEPWLVTHSRHEEINVQKDLGSEHSVYRFYQELLKLRKENAAFPDGDLEVISEPEDDYLIYIRKDPDMAAAGGTAGAADQSSKQADAGDHASLEAADPAAAAQQSTADLASDESHGTGESEKWAVICNFASEQSIDLPFECEPPALTNYGRGKASGIYAPYECAVAKIR